MCSGKTTVGELLSEKLRWRFIDLDKEIENRESMSIPDIFKTKGEDYFRKLELSTLRELSNLDRAVISTGGGLGANPEAMNLMKEKGFVVWLDLSFEEFLKRCGNDENRPLLKRSIQELRELFEKRREVYSKAHLHLEPDSPEQLVEKIAKARESFPGISQP